MIERLDFVRQKLEEGKIVFLRIELGKGLREENGIFLPADENPKYPVHLCLSRVNGSSYQYSLRITLPKLVTRIYAAPEGYQVMERKFDTEFVLWTGFGSYEQVLDDFIREAAQFATKYCKGGE